MPVIDKRFYNEASAAKLGWELSWFCAEDFDETLEENVKDFQRQHDLVPDGLVGPKTFRRIFTEMEAKLELVKNLSKTEENYIICEGRSIPIKWDKLVGLHDPGTLALGAGCYQASLSFVRKPTMIVTHWDAALSAKSCHKILQRRGLSSHFVIDNDGTIYQMVDTNNVAWHAKGSNDHSIGIDFSNAYYPKYQKVYRKRGLGTRPVLTSSVHGASLGDHLGYYPAQLEAYKALVATLCEHYDIPLECPEEDGKLVTGVHEDSQDGKFSGVVCHYHLSRRKIDCAGLELDVLLQEIKTN